MRSAPTHQPLHPLTMTVLTTPDMANFSGNVQPVERRGHEAAMLHRRLCPKLEARFRTIRREAPVRGAAPAGG